MIPPLAHRQQAVCEWARRVMRDGVGSPATGAVLHFEWQSEDLSLAAFQEVGDRFDDPSDVLQFEDGTSALVAEDTTEPEYEAAVATIVDWLHAAWLAARGASRYRKAFAHVHDTIFVVDLDTRVVLWRRADPPPEP